MFGRTVTIDGTEVFVFCVPSTPYSEVLQRAANQLRREEQHASDNHPDTIAYRRTIESICREMGQS